MITAPGAPLTGFAVPASTPPRPSPNHRTPSDHAIEAASAALTVGRQAIPRAISSCTVANAALITVRWCPTSQASQLIGRATTAGVPRRGAPNIWLEPVVDMEGLYCRTASSSQIAAQPKHSHHPDSGAGQPG